MGQNLYRFFLRSVFLVTDYERKFVLGVATPQDLEVNFFSSELFTTDPILFRCSHSSRDAAYRPHHAILIMTFFRHVSLPCLQLGLFRTSTIQNCSCQYRIFPHNERIQKSLNIGHNF